MPCTVIPFSLARFTPDDIEAFRAIAAPRLLRGLWAGYERETGTGIDRLLVSFPNIDRPVFSFERDRTGTYRLWFHDRQGWHDIGKGRSAAECLAIWRPRAPAPARAPASPRMAGSKKAVRVDVDLDAHAGGNRDQG